MFIFHGIGNFAMKLDDISFPDESQTFRPEGKGSFDSHTFLNFHFGFIHQFMDRSPSQGIEILIECLFDMNQRTLPRTIAPVL